MHSNVKEPLFDRILYLALTKRFIDLTQINRDRFHANEIRMIKRPRHQLIPGEDEWLVEDLLPTRASDEKDALDAQVKATQVKATQRPILGESCPMCMEDFTEGEDKAKVGLIYCQDQCGKSMHEACMLQCYHATKSVNCPFCRTPMRHLNIPDRGKPGGKRKFFV